MPDILRESGILGAQHSSGLGGTYSAKSGTEAFAQAEGLLTISVFFFDDKAFAVNSDSFRQQSKRFHFLLQDGWVDQRPRGDKQTGARIDEARRQLAENNVLAILIDEGVAGVGSATADTNIHILVFRDEGGNLPLAFRTILTANYNPKTHD